LPCARPNAKCLRRVAYLYDSITMNHNVFLIPSIQWLLIELTADDLGRRLQGRLSRIGRWIANGRIKMSDRRKSLEPAPGPDEMAI